MHKITIKTQVKGDVKQVWNFIIILASTYKKRKNEK